MATIELENEIKEDLDRIEAEIQRLMGEKALLMVNMLGLTQKGYRQRILLGEPVAVEVSDYGIARKLNALYGHPKRLKFMYVKWDGLFRFVKHRNRSMRRYEP